MTRILVVDNYDSVVFNLVQYLESLPGLGGGLQAVAGLVQQPAHHEIRT